MGAGGFEPPKAEPTGLQPAPFGHSGTPARARHCSRRPSLPPTIRVERFDVVVVGAGPAGSTTAIRLARAGARVLLLDKARVPARQAVRRRADRSRAARAARRRVDPVVEHVVDRFELGLRYGRGFERRSRGPLDR